MQNPRKSIEIKKKKKILFTLFQVRTAQTKLSPKAHFKSKREFS